jgi:small subunit ribosomal protein S6
MTLLFEIFSKSLYDRREVNMLREYETTFVVDAHLPTDQIEQTIEKFIKYITDNDGVLRHSDRWGKRRLAYEIKKKQYGYYVYLRFAANGEMIKALDREYRLDESILRYLTVLTPKKVVQNEDFSAVKPSAADLDDEDTEKEDASGYEPYEEDDQEETDYLKDK